MLRFKQITGQGQELENAVNGWLEEFEPDVSQMVQTALDDGTVLMSFLFDESFRGQERRLASKPSTPVATRPSDVEIVSELPVAARD